MSDNDFRSTVLSCLNIFGEVFINETSITHIGDFEEEAIVEFDLNALPNKYGHVNAFLNIRPFIVLFAAVLVIHTATNA